MSPVNPFSYLLSRVLDESFLALFHFLLRRHQLSARIPCPSFRIESKPGFLASESYSFFSAFPSSSTLPIQTEAYESEGRKQSETGECRTRQVKRNVAESSLAKRNAAEPDVQFNSTQVKTSSNSQESQVIKKR